MRQKNISIILIVLVTLLLIVLVIWMFNKKLDNIERRIKAPVTLKIDKNKIVPASLIGRTETIHLSFQ